MLPAPKLLDSAVDRLTRFWTTAGCRLVPACDLAAPAATVHPDHVFGLFGPSPLRTVCVQPVLRPLDARGGQHPYRSGRQLHIQVALRGNHLGSGAPEDVRGLYLESLAALGLDPGISELRFAEYRLEALSLGVRGEGWKSLVDGLVVARLCALQTLAGEPLDPVSWEITYSAERLAVVFGEIGMADGDDGATEEAAGGVFRRRDEDELLRYFGEVASSEFLTRQVEAFHDEARRALDAGLARRGYELAARSLSDIDLLDARGELSGREREALLQRVGTMVGRVAELRREDAEAGAVAEPGAGGEVAVQLEEPAGLKSNFESKERVDDA